MVNFINESYKNFDRQNIIFYPNFHNFKLFTRINFYEKDSSIDCKNSGIYFKKIKKCLCLPGFHGSRCEYVCDQPYKFGENCEYSCINANCSGYLVCTLDPIGCTCLSGYTGYDCSTPCTKSEYNWGPNCQFRCNQCLNISGSCNIYTGQCTCKNEFIKGNFCDECIPGYYGNDCTEKCPIQNCHKCDKITGKCSSCKTNLNCLDVDCIKCINCSNECINFNCDKNQHVFCDSICSQYDTECKLICQNRTCIKEENILTTSKIKYLTSSKISTQIEEKNKSADKIVFIWLLILVLILVVTFSLNFYIERKIHMKSMRFYKYIDLKLNKIIPLSNEDFFNFKQN